MSRGDDPAFPARFAPMYKLDLGGPPPTEQGHPGMTLREWYAGQALAGLSSVAWEGGAGRDGLVVEAMHRADALLAALRESDRPSLACAPERVEFGGNSKPHPDPRDAVVEAARVVVDADIGLNPAAADCQLTLDAKVVALCTALAALDSAERGGSRG